MQTTVQVSLDFANLGDALHVAAMALRAGVDWLEAGTPLVMSEGERAIRELRLRYLEVPIVADVKMMDGGWKEVKLMAEAGANLVVVMGQAHPETIEMAVEAGHDFGVKIMGDNMAMPDPVTGARRLEELGCDYIVHHIGYDMRTLRAKRGVPVPSALDRLREIVEAVSIPVEAVGGLTIEEAIQTPEYGAPLVVIGAPLVGKKEGDVEPVLKMICERVHAYGDVKTRREASA